MRTIQFYCKSSIRMVKYIVSCTENEYCFPSIFYNNDYLSVLQFVKYSSYRTNLLLGRLLQPIVAHLLLLWNARRLFYEINVFVVAAKEFLKSLFFYVKLVYLRRYLGRANIFVLLIH